MTTYRKSRADRKKWIVSNPGEPDYWAMYCTSCAQLIDTALLHNETCRPCELEQSRPKAA